MVIPDRYQHFPPNFGMPGGYRYRYCNRNAYYGASLPKIRDKRITFRDDIFDKHVYRIFNPAGRDQFVCSLKSF